MRRWAVSATYADGYEAYKIVEWPERKGAELEEGRGPRAKSEARPRRKESTPRGEGRVKGPVQSTIPRPTGWKVDGQPVNLGLLSVNKGPHEGANEQAVQALDSGGSVARARRDRPKD